MCISSLIYFVIKSVPVLANIFDYNRGYELALYQRGTKLGIIQAEYTQSWVQGTKKWELLGPGGWDERAY